MKLTWLGHASFLFEDSDGRKLLTDPFDETVGYPIFKGRADVITVSHNHFDHNYIKLIGNDAKIIDKVGDFNQCDIPVRGIPSFHDEVKGAKRGENIIFIIEMDGYKICHLGDLGHLLTDEDLDMIGDVDILLIPVGGNYTISGSEAATIANSIKAKIIIPMHYKTPQLTFPLDGVENFLTHMKNGERINSSSIIIEDILDENKNKVLILNP